MASTCLWESLWSRGVAGQNGFNRAAGSTLAAERSLLGRIDAMPLTDMVCKPEGFEVLRRTLIAALTWLSLGIDRHV